jgi:hypothetical protein
LFYDTTLEQLFYWDGTAWQEIGGGAVDSVFGRTGVVVAASSDYDANQVDFSPAGDIAATDVQAAIEELDVEKTAVGHTHSKLVASDGSPDPALSADANGYIDIQGKGAFKGYDSWLRVNADGDFGSGIHTPGYMQFGGGIKVYGGVFQLRYGTTINNVATSLVNDHNNVPTGAAVTSTYNILLNHAVRRRATSNQLIAHATTTTLVFHAEDFDPLGWMSSTRFQPNVSGYYLITFTAAFQGCPSGTIGILYAIDNSGTIRLNPFEYSHGTSIWMSGSTITYMNGVTDWLEARIYHNAGSSKYTNSANQRVQFCAALLKR